jgi:hypothetical protein
MLHGERSSNTDSLISKPGSRRPPAMARAPSDLREGTAKLTHNLQPLVAIVP